MRIKLLVVVILIAGFIYYSNHRKQSISTAKSEKVLGSQTQQDKGIKNMIVDTAQSALNSAANFVDSQTAKTTAMVGDYVFSVTSQNVIKQLDKLPASQKEEIKKELCK